MVFKRKYLCWLLVAVMFCVFASGGCGGGSSSGGSSDNDSGTSTKSEEGTSTPKTPDNPTSDETTTNTSEETGENLSEEILPEGAEGTIEGTWEPVNGTWVLAGDGFISTGKYRPGSASLSHITLSVSESEYSGYTSIKVDGEDDSEVTEVTGTFDFDDSYTRETSLIPIGVVNYLKEVAKNTYKSDAPGSYGSNVDMVIQLTESNTLMYYVNIHSVTEYTLVMNYKRVE